MTVKIKTNSHNKEYLDLMKVDLSVLILLPSMPYDIQNKIRGLYNKMFTFERTSGCGYIKKICIRKDSEIGEFLLNCKDIDIINEDTLISYKKVVNAYNTAIYTRNPIHEKIHPMFMENVSGKYEDLVGTYGKDTLDYILANPNFKRYIERTSPDYDYKMDTVDCIVYEYGEFGVKTFTAEPYKIKKI